MEKTEKANSRDACGLIINVGFIFGTWDVSFDFDFCDWRKYY